MGKQKSYGLGVEKALRRVQVPSLSHEPQDSSRYRPGIAVIGCGGISGWHLTAYRKAGYHVAALCDVAREAAEKRRQEFFPKAPVFQDYRGSLERDDIDVVDIALHPEARLPVMEAAIRAGKHVLSQKPFVLDLDEGERLAALADYHGVRLAVNQNGRWAPHFRYMREAIRRNLVGEVMSAHLSVHWNHDWLAGTAFDSVPHALLYDFAIHWFDIARLFLAGKEPKAVFATVTAAPGQKSKPPLLGQAMMAFEGGQASLSFDALARFGPQDRTYVAGAKGSLTSIGPNLSKQKVTLFTAKGFGSPRLKGSWFPDGFHGAMVELLLAIEEKREPSHGARDNMKSLAVCFAAVASAEEGRPVAPGSVRRMPGM